ncbi:hypothetical protein GKZ89_10080 [Bacillus mangrovi]|uniref:Uncharacterized protein n=1 Tax=Metabacillus mangrovi TaxID=1491830 RepID=A0A7X2S5G1_9BACI|nr:hypothetical protein [Metabacillus mangrovi]MTH53752.1 hypothetical protein [Metabacillus mangrovi]
MEDLILAASGLLFIWYTVQVLKDWWGAEYRGRSAADLLIRPDREKERE